MVPASTLWNVTVLKAGLACFATNPIVKNVFMDIAVLLGCALVILDTKVPTVTNAKKIHIVCMEGVSTNRFNVNAGMGTKATFVTFQSVIVNVTLNM